MSGRRRAALGAAALVLLALAGTEAAFRLLAGRLGIDRERLARFRAFVWTRAETAHYEARPHVLFARRPGRPGINRLGFIDDDFPAQKRAGVLRVACLGSSTTEGGNAEGRAGSYPRFLRDILAARRPGGTEVLNFGMSGWTTAEILVNYVLTVQDFSPDVVVLHEGANDVEARAWPGFRSDYSHYRRPWQDVRFSLPYRLAVQLSDAFAALALRRAGPLDIRAVVVRPPQGPLAVGPDGTLPEPTAAAFRRNVRTLAELVRLRGGRTVLATMPYDPPRTPAVYRAGIEEHNRILREIAGELELDLVDLASVAGEAGCCQGFFLDLVHMTPQGNRWKAERIAEAVLAARQAP